MLCNHTTIFYFFLHYHLSAADNMAKRPNADSDTDSPYKKRQRITKKVIGKYAPTEINSLQDLQGILTFTQDTVSGQFRQGMTTYPTFTTCSY